VVTSTERKEKPAVANTAIARGLVEQPVNHVGRAGEVHGARWSRGLARSVGADEGGDDAVSQAQGDAVTDRAAGLAGHEVVAGQHVTHEVGLPTPY
jgi:hypothetical protein